MRISQVSSVRIPPHMTMRKRSAIVSPDGILDLPATPVIADNEKYGAPELQGHMVVRGITHNAHLALAERLAQEGQLEVIGKSGSSRVGLEVIQRDGEKVQVDHQAGSIIVPVGVLSVRAVEVRQNGVRDDLLSVLAAITRERDVAIGRVAMADPADALSREEVLAAFQKNELALPAHPSPEACVDEQGHLVLPLESLRFAFCEANFRTAQKRDVIRFGKHGLAGLQEERQGLPKEIGGKQFFVGGIRVSIGPYIGIIDAETNKPGVVHLAARILDGIRTTGLDDPRQVELFNQLYDAVSTGDLRVRIRLHHASKDAQQFAKCVINRRTIVSGVSLPDVIELQGHPERIMDLMRLVSPSVADGNPCGYFVGPGRAHKVEWVDEASDGFQNRHLEIAAPKFSAGDPDYCVRGQEIPQEAEVLAGLLGYVGQDQSHSRLYAQWGFPDTDTMRFMNKSGIGVFVAHDVRVDPERTYESRIPMLTRRRTVLFSPAGERGGATVERQPSSDIFFDDKRFAAFQKMYGEGARFLLVRHEAPDAFDEAQTVPEEVLVWDERGFWVRPEAQERLEKVDTLIAMYGSHVDGMTEVLTEQVNRFALRMKKLFGESVGFIHGKGPGVMYLADVAARNLPEIARGRTGYEEIDEGILSLGVGIDLEQQDQAINYHPHAQVDFSSQHRLVRQKHMNDRTSFNIFNLGGAGTLEEVALSLCSQKLYKNILTPLIFVDPKGISNEGDNYWNKLKVFIDDMATRKEISSGVAGQASVNIQLLQGHMKNFVHVVDSYDEAADIIEGFVKDPVGYYVKAGVAKKEFIAAYNGALEVRQDTHFPMPHWMDVQRYSSMFEDDRWLAEGQETS